MSGHSKWATIKHKKGKEDARRGKLFTKFIREIITAARIGGGNIDTNPRLRAAVTAAKQENMPKTNIENAIKKGTGELEGEIYEELMYEGYGPGGVAVLVRVMTDNKNRSAAEIRHIFSRYGGDLGEAGCVGWMFKQKGQFLVPDDAITEDRLLEISMNLDVEDVSHDEDGRLFEVMVTPPSFEAVKTAYDKEGIKYTYAEVTLVPQTYVPLKGREAEQMLKLMEALDDHDDVQKVYANFDISEKDMEALQG
ncbi:MAG: YebC/PmpR family DNA-binding transcriptional regulator [Deltaproteobacteria bacterium]|nr:YebC/PmpR family DNA-binding transcriptional regulator [Deltaproteobacteria bacterium]MCL5277819.1 YebC/PmpR family DNA-binding transcriptional regulator [Deltaproteobacteria bacterium]